MKAFVYPIITSSLWVHYTRFFLLLVFGIFAVKTSVQAQQGTHFSYQIDTNFTTQTLVVGAPVAFDVLLLAQDCTVYNGKAFVPLSKTNFGGCSFHIDPNTAGDPSLGTVYVSLDANTKSVDLGDGGGVVSFRVERARSGRWQVIPSKVVGGRKVFYSLIDASKIGGTCNNGTGHRYAGISSVDGNIYETLIPESRLYRNNRELAEGFADTSDFKIPASITQSSQENYVVPTNTTLKRYQQMGWVTKVNTESNDFDNKIYGMGRGGYAHVAIGPGGIYMTTGRTPSVLFKYVKREKYEEHGDLYFYKETEFGGTFLPLTKYDTIFDKDGNVDQIVPKQLMDSLLIIEEQALRNGATMFASLEGMCVDDQNSFLFIAERGIDDSDNLFTDPKIKFNGVLAKHLASKATAGRVRDPHGRILYIGEDFALGKVQVLLEGGRSADGKKVLSNPVTISNAINTNGENQLLIRENIFTPFQGRNPAFIRTNNTRINESYYTPALKQNELGDGFEKLSVDNLFLCNIAPRGASLKGNSNTLSKGTLNSESLFSVINSPNTSNRTPFRRSSVVAFRNINAVNTPTNPIATEEAIEHLKAGNFIAWPNPSNEVVYLNSTSDIAVYDANGVLKEIYKNVSQINVSNFLPGIYFIKNTDKQVLKLVVQ